MPIQWSEESAYAKEVARWDRPKRDGGMRPDSFEMFPQMLYRAVVRENGKAVIAGDPARYRGLTNPADAAMRLAEEEAVTASCQLIVRSQAEADRAFEQGWRDHPQAALDHHAALQRVISDAAAERHFSDQRMTAKAKRDAAQADAAAGIEHVADVPVPKERGRPARSAIGA